jgi:hypothetical protein
VARKTQGTGTAAWTFTGAGVGRCFSRASSTCRTLPRTKGFGSFRARFRYLLAYFASMWPNSSIACRRSPGSPSSRAHHRTAATFLRVPSFGEVASKPGNSTASARTETSRSCKARTNTSVVVVTRSAPMMGIWRIGGVVRRPQPIVVCASSRHNPCKRRRERQAKGTDESLDEVVHPSSIGRWADSSTTVTVSPQAGGTRHARWHPPVRLETDCPDAS